ncbi:MAG TPA: ABC transporter ATP-binding protein [Jatrophihabitantaceae bacterium]|nr:ABC transporter ATP-binding protein [Jatrophihabitantaceae bacterium]
MALLEVTGVTVRFGGVTAVDNASISVESGSITGLIGPNGAGKTTLFNVITGLQEPTKGRVRFRNQEVTKSSPNARAKLGMGRTFQRLEAFGSLTVRENILVAREIHAGVRSWFTRRQDKAVDQIIERVGLGRYVNQRADSVPTGVARLLEMGRALAIEPRLLLLDEPSSGLDEAETESFGDLLDNLAADGMAILMVEHDMELVMRVCHLIHVLEFGRVIATGTAAEIRADATVQAAYLGFVDESDSAAVGATASLNEFANATEAESSVGDTALLTSIPASERTIEFPPVPFMDEDDR